MKLLKIITDKDVSEQDVEKDNLLLRNAVRAVLLNDRNEVAVLYVKSGDYHKIPGGGVKENEGIKEALRRELVEEAGVEDAEIVNEIGEILEYRGDVEQHSFCYLAKVRGDINKPKFTKKEILNGFSGPIWLPIDRAIELLKKDTLPRDRIFLEVAAKMLKT